MEAVDMTSGDIKFLKITLLTGVGGSAISLSGVSGITWGLWPVAGGAQLITKTLGSGIAVTNSGAGEFTVTLTEADTSSLAGVYYWEARVNFSGSAAVVQTGTLNIATRRTALT